jgi:hypothetical protein
MEKYFIFFSWVLSIILLINKFLFINKIETKKSLEKRIKYFSKKNLDFLFYSLIYFFLFLGLILFLRIKAMGKVIDLDVFFSKLEKISNYNFFIFSFLIILFFIILKILQKFFLRNLEVSHVFCKKKLKTYKIFVLFLQKTLFHFFISLQIFVFKYPFCLSLVKFLFFILRVYHYLILFLILYLDIILINNNCLFFIFYYLPFFLLFSLIKQFFNFLIKKEIKNNVSKIN